MTEEQFYKNPDRTIKVPAYYTMQDGRVVLDEEEIQSAFESELDRVRQLASYVKA